MARRAERVRARLRRPAAARRADRRARGAARRGRRRRRGARRRARRPAARAPARRRARPGRAGHAAAGAARPPARRPHARAPARAGRGQPVPRARGRAGPARPGAPGARSCRCRRACRSSWAAASTRWRPRRARRSTSRRRWRGRPRPTSRPAWAPTRPRPRWRTPRRPASSSATASGCASPTRSSRRSPTPASRRAALRAARRLAGALSDPEERAWHLALSAGGPDAEVAAALEDAALRARARGAPGAAAELWEQARRLTPAADPTRPRGGASRAPSGASRPATWRARTACSTSIAASGGPSRARALALLGWVRAQGGGYRAGAEVFAQALAEAGDDEALRIEIEEGLAWCVHSTDGLAAARPFARAGARAGGGARRSVGAGRRALASRVPRVADGRGRGAGAHRARRGPRRRRPELVAGARPARLDPRAAARLGGPHAASHEHFDALRADAAERGDEHSLPFILFQVARCELLLGDWAAADGHAAECRDLSALTGQAGERPYALTIVGLVDAHYGRVEAAPRGHRRGDRARPRVRRRPGRPRAARDARLPGALARQPRRGLDALADGRARRRGDRPARAGPLPLARRRRRGRRRARAHRRGRRAGRRARPPGRAAPAAVGADDGGARPRPARRHGRATRRGARRAAPRAGAARRARRALRARPHAARPGHGRAPRPPEGGRARGARGCARALRGARRRLLGRAGARRARPRRRPRRERRADADRAPRGRADRGRPHLPRGGRRALHQPQDRAVEPLEGLRASSACAPAPSCRPGWRPRTPQRPRASGADGAPSRSSPSSRAGSARGEKTASPS